MKRQKAIRHSRAIGTYGHSLLFGAAVFLLAGASASAAGMTLTPEQIFKRRLMPIFRSSKPSSCMQCHLGGAVQLKNYILRSHKKTFLSLRDLKLIDLNNPADSKILQLIKMGGTEPKGGVSLITAKMRKAEYEAFAQWIIASAKDPELRNAPKLRRSELARPKTPNEVIRFTRKDRLLKSFESRIWSQRFRCISCHLPGQKGFLKHLKKYKREKLEIFKGTAQATMEHIIQKKLVDPRNPRNSKLLLKPLNFVKHGGGKKMQLGDSGYMAFLRWVEDYSKVVSKKVKKTSDLPKGPQHYGTEIWMKFTNAPNQWKDRLFRVTIQAKEPKRSAWQKKPIAEVFGAIQYNKGRRWFQGQSTLILLARKRGRASTEVPVKPKLTQGRYLVRVYLGPKATGKQVLGSAQLRYRSYVGQMVVQSRWPSGFKSKTEFDARQLKR